MNEQAFLSDIIEHPDDDAPRLVLADWLEEQGEDERAEFIRLQCHLARLGEQAPERPALEEREEELLAAYRREWAGPIPDVVDRWLFRRGLVEGLALDNGDGEGLLASYDDLFHRYPIRLLQLEMPEVGHLQWLLEKATERLARLEALDLNGLDRVDPEHISQLIDSPAAAGLRTLLLEHEYLDDRWLDALQPLGRSNALGELNELGLAFGTLNEERLPAELLQAIASAPYPAGLTRLHIPFLRFGVNVARVIGRSPTLSGLTHLDLGCCYISLAGWQALLRGPNLTRLRWLALFGARVVLEEEQRVSLEEHPLCADFQALLPDVLDFETSETFPRWQGCAP